MADHRHEQSQEPLSDSRQPKQKKRRLHGACDACRKKKGIFLFISFNFILYSLVILLLYPSSQM